MPRSFCVRRRDLDPRNPGTLKNLAETSYLMNDSVSAKNYWQRLADLGPGVGTMYALAKDHVLLLNSTADANTLTQPSPFPRTTYIDEVEKTPVETSNGQPSFHLRAVLMRKDSRLPFDQNKLQVYVIFYRETPDGHLVPDLSQRKGAFEKQTFLFWHNKLKEPFGVDYLMPRVGIRECQRRRLLRLRHRASITTRFSRTFTPSRPISPSAFPSPRRSI